MLDKIKHREQVAFGTILKLGGTAQDALLKSTLSENPEIVAFDRKRKAVLLDNLRKQLANDSFKDDTLLIYRSSSDTNDNVDLVLGRKGKFNLNHSIEMYRIPTNNLLTNFNKYLLELRGKMARKISAISNQKQLDKVLERFKEKI